MAAEDHPRIRGEHFFSIYLASDSAGSSPHTRGALLRGDAFCGVPGIIPAYAGSTPSRSGRQRSPRDHPRIRGEHRLFTEYERRGGGSSPHTRGARLRRQRCDSGIGIIPAYAGSTRARHRRCAAARDHPRIRGEHHMRVGHLPSTTGSSPHTRGAPRASSTRGRQGRIIPAYAGSTTQQQTVRLDIPDHPRIRGEHISCSRFVPAIMGSSPHTRGALDLMTHFTYWKRIIPAYAGSTKPSLPASVVQPDHPRIRGEHEADNIGATAKQGSSPHTRGAHSCHIPSVFPPRIIPAYAGSTAFLMRISIELKDHPRIRGEHALCSGISGQATGSSPHTRGAH